MVKRRKYDIEVKPPAERDLSKIQRRDQLRIAARIEGLVDDPRPPGAQKLEGSDDLYRIRQGSYRIIYRVIDDPPLVTVARIRRRGDVYRGL